MRCQSSLTFGGMTGYLSENRRYACDSSESRGPQQLRRAAALSSAARTFGAPPPAAAEDKFYRITATHFRLVRVLRRRRTAGLRPEQGFVMPPDACEDRHRRRKGNRSEISCLKVRKIGQKVIRQRFFCFPLGAYAQLLLTLQ